MIEAGRLRNAISFNLSCSGSCTWKASGGKLQEADPAAQSDTSVAEKRQVLPQTQELAVVASIYESQASSTS